MGVQILNKDVSLISSIANVAKAQINNVGGIGGWAGGGGTPASQGPNYGTSAVNDNSNGGVMNWVSPAEANSTTNDAASFSTGDTSFVTSVYLKLSGYGFSIPTGATITGITVDVRRRRILLGSVSAYDVELKLLKNNVIVGNNKADTTTNWPLTTYSTVTYGGATDLWGTSWTASDINNSNFGIVFSVKTVSGNPKQNAGVNVDYINIKIDYTA